MTVSETHPYEDPDSPEAIVRRMGPFRARSLREMALLAPENAYEPGEHEEFLAWLTQERHANPA
ncbi:hypothetical protein [Crossiella sp. CA198]|uniref:hypothetical protein n=1 Tax=Crossiella sp. CA198 TaxID=3455607 RepID=UPI003F8D727B